VRNYIAHALRSFAALVILILVLYVFRRLLEVGYFHDDWTFLARAIGILPPPDIPHRPLAFNFYWKLMGGMFGFEPVVYTYSRFMLHICTGLLLVRLGRHLKISEPLNWLLGSIYLMSPLAFEPLYWASGVTDLLANIGLVVAVFGAIVGNRRGVLLFLLGGIVSLASKETGWWLFGAGILAYRRHRQREYLWSAGVFALAAVVAIYVVAEALRADYGWTFRAVPWNWLRAGSWLLPRPDDLIRVWEADTVTLLIGGLVWLLWVGYAVFRWHRKDKVPALSLLAAWLSLAPVVGLDGHMVPRYLLPVLAAHAVTLGTIIRIGHRAQYLVVPLVVVGLALYTMSCVGEMLDRSYPLGRPAHRMVAKERMVRSIWSYFNAHGVSEKTGIAFYSRSTDDTDMRKYMLDVIGYTWGPRVVLGSQTRVVLAERITQIPPRTPVFQFGHWSLEYLGTLETSP
jgi:hypothetical protein